MLVVRAHRLLVPADDGRRLVSTGRDVLEQLRARTAAREAGEELPDLTLDSEVREPETRAPARVFSTTCRCGHARAAHVTATAMERQGCTAAGCGCVVFLSASVTEWPA